MARHAEQAKFSAACELLVRAAHLVTHWPHNFADEASKALAPRAIESAIPSRFRTNFKGFWDEYVMRLGGRKDEEHVKAHLLELMQRVISETVG